MLMVFHLKLLHSLSRILPHTFAAFGASTPHSEYTCMHIGVLEFLSPYHGIMPLNSDPTTVINSFS